MGRAGGNRTTYRGTEIQVWLDGVVNHVARVSTVSDLLKKLERWSGADKGGSCKFSWTLILRTKDT